MPTGQWKRCIKLRTNTVAGIVALLLCILLTAQDDPCFNSDFEDGSYEGWKGYIGAINEEGVVELDFNSSFSYPNHTLQYDLDAFDPIALACGIEVPTVAPGGTFSLKLGDAWGGSNAEAVVKTITVGPENTYFHLRYAVILEDPDHLPHEQPRFQIRISDENGDVSTCGSYLVVAQDEIEGFENCGDWRIRNWTDVTLELWSYLGQTIQIEFITTDCSQGAHAGYAYIDGYCGALDITVDPHCEGAASLDFATVEDLDSYLWNTGDTTYNITVNDPIPGDVYCVLVNEVTGCSVEICDTVPEIIPLPNIFLEEIKDTIICQGDSISLKLTGDYIANAYWLIDPAAGPEITIAPTESDYYLYHIEGLEDCYEILDSVWVDVSFPPIYGGAPETYTICSGDSITLQGSSSAVGDSFYWPAFDASDSSITLWPENALEVELIIRDSLGCFETLVPFQIDIIEVPELLLTASANSICLGQETTVWVENTEDLEVYWLDSQEQATSINLLLDASQEVLAIAQTSDGCWTDTASIFIDVNDLDLPEYEVSLPAVCLGSTVQAEIEGSAISNVLWTNGDDTFSGNSYEFIALESTFVVYEVSSENGCSSIQDSIWSEVYSAPDYSFQSNLPSCPSDSTLLLVEIDSTSSISWADFPNNSNSQWVKPSESQSYTFFVTDEHNCITIEEQIHVWVQNTIDFNVSLSANNVCAGEIVNLQTDLDSDVNYQWFNESGDEVNSEIVATQTGIYCATSYSSLNCPSEQECIELIVLPDLPITYNAEDYQICQGESLALEVTGENISSVSWSNFNGFSSLWIVSPDSTTTYYFQVTDLTGCKTIKDSVQVEVFYPASFTNSPSTVTACLGDLVLLEVFTDESNDISWSTSNEESNSLAFFAETAESVTAEITANEHCPSTAVTFEINLHESSEVELLSSEEKVCPYQEVNLTATGNEGTNFMWLGSDFIGEEATFLCGQDSTISVTGIDSNGCLTDTASVTISVYPKLSIEMEHPPLEICLGESILIEATGNNIGSAYWTEQDNDQLSMTVSPTSDQFYPVTLSDPNNCSFKEDSLLVIVHQPKTPELTQVSAPICEGSEIELEVINANEFSGIYWDSQQNSEATFTLTASESFQLLVEAIDTNGCQSESQEIWLEVQALPAANFEVPEWQVCEGDSIELVLDIDGVSEIDWSDGYPVETPVFIKINKDTVLTAVLTDSIGCASKAYMIPVDFIPQAKVELGENACYTSKQILDATLENASYEWSTGEETPTIEASYSDLFWVKVFTECSEATDSIYLDINETNCTITPPSAFTPNSDGLNDFFLPVTNCSQDSYIDYHFKVFDRWGDLVFQSDNIHEAWNGSYRGREASVGVYVWTLTYENILCGTIEQSKGNVTVVR